MCARGKKAVRRKTYCSAAFLRLKRPVRQEGGGFSGSVRKISYPPKKKIGEWAGKSRGGGRFCSVPLNPGKKRGSYHGAKGTDGRHDMVSRGEKAEKTSEKRDCSRSGGNEMLGTSSVPLEKENLEKS